MACSRVESRLVYASSVSFNDAPALIEIEVMKMLTLLNASIAVVAVNKPIAVAWMRQLTCKSPWAVRKLARVIRVGIGGGLNLIKKN